jgi:hypothetical protein
MDVEVPTSWYLPRLLVAATVVVSEGPVDVVGLQGLHELRGTEELVRDLLDDVLDLIELRGGRIGIPRPIADEVQALEDVQWRCFAQKATLHPLWLRCSHMLLP